MASPDVSYNRKAEMNGLSEYHQGFQPSLTAWFYPQESHVENAPQFQEIVPSYLIKLTFKKNKETYISALKGILVL